MRSLRSTVVAAILVAIGGCGDGPPSDNSSVARQPRFLITPSSGLEFFGSAILTAKESRPERIELSLSGSTDTEYISILAFLDPSLVRDESYVFRVAHLRATSLGEATLTRCPVADPSLCEFGEAGEIAANRGSRISGTFADISPRLSGSFDGEYLFECFVVSTAPGGPDGGHNADTGETSGLIQDIALTSDFCRQFRDL